MRLICSKVLSYLIRHESGYGSPNFMVLWRLACRAQQQEQKPKETLKDKDLNINDMHTWTSAIIKKKNWSINAKTLGSLYHPPTPATEKARQLHPDHSGPRAQRHSANALCQCFPSSPGPGGNYDLGFSVRTPHLYVLRIWVNNVLWSVWQKVYLAEYQFHWNM